LAGCSSPAEVSLNEDPSVYAEEEAELEAQLAETPSDGTALRDLGAIYVRTGRPTKAYDHLKEAYRRMPTDPKTLFFLGLASEQVGRRNAALQLFQTFDEVPADSRYHTLMQGRYEWLVRQDARQTMQELVAQEKARSTENLTDRIDRQAVALMPLQYNGTDARYQPLGRGLAEMMATDLAQVDRVTVVERVRLQALLDELKLAESEAVDASTAPRVGRLLGAGRLVGGSYVIADGDRVRLTLDLADVLDGSVRPVTSEDGRLDNLFRLQTQIVFDLVDAFGVELTAQERDAIEQVPTRDLQAFLAYSRGLLEEDRGNFQAAREQFQQAAQIDPAFRPAAQGAARTQGLSAAGGSAAQAVAAAVPPPGPTPTERLLQRRMQTMMGADPTLTSPEQQIEQITILEDLLRLPPPPPSSTSGGGGG